jgi:23S rRNA (cytidine2498-2'-O)-methyltransferase
MPSGTDSAPAPVPGAHAAAWHALLAYCRPGFENDCVQELIARANASGIAGYGKARDGEGFAAFVTTDDTEVDALLAPPPAIFARQLLHAFAQLRDLPADDRLTPVMAALEATGARWCDAWVESPDSDAGRELAALTRGFGNVLKRELRRRGLLHDKAPRRLHVCFVDGRNVLLAQADPRHAAPWPGGIPRLRRLSGAPSRSAAKLDEAIHVLLDAGERERWLRPGMSAVDLGAAPGGWSWVLAQRHVRVEAIDNGPLAQNVIDSGLVRHIRADGFSWRPAKPVDWLVCDMVEQPSRVAALIGSWLADGACRRALFNLKLPMKKRYAETLRCLELLRERAGRPLDLRCRQLYHDREEVTVAALPR